MRHALRWRLALVAALSSGAALADPIALATAGSAAFCKESGQSLQLAEGTLTEIDLTGDGVPDAIVSEEGATCSPDGDHLGGTGGSMIHAVVGDTVTSRLAKGWAVQQVGFGGRPMTVLLFALHGSACEGIGADPCVEALVWSGDSFLSVVQPLDAAE